MPEYNAGERSHVKDAARRLKAKESQEATVITAVMSHAAGRSWFCDILEQCHVFATSFHTNALQTAFNEGERSVGLRLILQIMQACPDSYITMMRERNERDAARSASRKPARDTAPTEYGGDDPGSEPAQPGPGDD